MRKDAVATCWIVLAAVVLVAIAVIAGPLSQAPDVAPAGDVRPPSTTGRWTRPATAARPSGELADRERRHEELDIRPLPEAARSRYAEEWQRVQARFVDDPEGAVGDGDRLVRRVMDDRGYPSDDDFERRAADVSVDYPDVVENYREGHGLGALSHERGRPDRATPAGDGALPPPLRRAARGRAGRAGGALTMAEGDRLSTADPVRRAGRGARTRADETRGRGAALRRRRRRALPLRWQEVQAGFVDEPRRRYRTPTASSPS